MRTTVTLEPDVAAALRAYAHRRRTAFKAALNELVRRGLGAAERPAGKRRFVVRPHAGGSRAGVDPAKLNQLADELETQDFLHEVRRRA